MKKGFVVDSPVGSIEVIYREQKICKVNLNCQKVLSEVNGCFEQNIFAQLQNYFIDAYHQFDLPLNVSGTEHQQAVWAQMLEIPRGEVKTYGEIATLIGSSGQAVGNACRANPIPIILPCHRVVAANAIGGFAGARQGRLLDIKQSLLAHEGVNY